MALVGDSIGSQGGAEEGRGSDTSPMLSLADVEAVIDYVDLDRSGEIDLKVRSYMDPYHLYNLYIKSHTKLKPLGACSVKVYGGTLHSPLEILYVAYTPVEVFVF